MVLILAALPWSLAAQAPVSAAGGSGASPPSAVSVTLQPALTQVAQTLSNLNIRRWKAPGSVRDAADNDVSSIQRDLSGTLAGLLQQADAAPGSVPAAFAVYRNVDALYDTLLRVVETAQLAAPDDEASALISALGNLESARSVLGENILSGSQTEQAELERLRTVIARAAANAAAPRPVVKTTIIDDGPAPEKETARRHHTARKPVKPAESSQKSNPQ